VTVFAGSLFFRPCAADFCRCSHIPAIGLQSMDTSYHAQL